MPNLFPIIYIYYFNIGDLNISLWSYSLPEGTMALVCDCGITMVMHNRHIGPT